MSSVLDPTVGSDPSPAESTAVDVVRSQPETANDDVGLRWTWIYTAVALAAAPLVIAATVRAFGGGPYWFLPAVPIAFGILYWMRHHGRPAGPQNRADWVWLGAALLLAAVAGVFGSVMTAGLALFAVTVVVCRRTEHTAGGVLGLTSVVTLGLVRLQPDLYGLVERTALRITAGVSSLALDTLGIPHLPQNLTLRLAGYDLTLTDLITFWPSVPFFFFVGVLLAAIRRPSWLAVPLYAPAALLAAIVAYSLHVIVSAWGYHSLSLDPNAGWFVATMAVASMAVGIGLMGSFHATLCFLTTGIGGEWEGTTNPLVALYNWVVGASGPERTVPATGRSFAPRSLGLGILVPSAIILALATLSIFREDAVERVSSTTLAPVRDTSTLTFAGAAPELQLQIAPTDEPQRLAAWQGEYLTIPVSVQFTQSFEIWPEISRTYQRTGWDLLDRTTIDLGDGGVFSDQDDAPRYVQARLKRDDGSQGYLWYGGVHADGESVAPPSLADGWKNRILRRFGVDDRIEPMGLVQMWVATGSKLEPERVVELRKQFESIYSQTLGR